MGFMPPIPLPGPNEGRSAAYLLNRLSNNVEENSLFPPGQEGRQEGFLVFPRILDYSYAASLLLSGIELGVPFPTDPGISRAEIEEKYEFLLGDAPDEDKRNCFLKIGESITGSSAMHGSLVVSVPSARTDLMKGFMPPTLNPDPGFSKYKHVIVKAISDYTKNKTTKKFKSNREKQEYVRAQETIIAGHRLLAVQTACMGILDHGIPIQTPETGGGLYSLARNLNTALTKRTKKISRLFRELEIKLAESLPDELLAHLVYGDSDIVFLSDLPYEWTLLDNWPVCLTRPVSRIPMSATNVWLNIFHASARQAKINISKPNRVVVLDLIDESDPIRNFSELFRKTSDDIGQKYTYRKPSCVREIKEIFDEVSPEIVVLDTHGNYRSMFDELLLSMGELHVKSTEFVGDAKVPPVWILSACDMSVVGAIKGTMVEPLINKGAVCVIATVQKIDAMAASIFVGRLLTDIYSPPAQIKYNTLLDAFFVSQFTTALLYDPLLPLLKRARPGTDLSKRVCGVIFEYIRHFSSKPFDPRKMKYEAGEVLYKNIIKQGLQDQQTQIFQTGEVIPETLLFTAFGLPSKVSLISDQAV